MNFDDFQKSLEEKYPPKDLSQLLLALWYDAKGDWERSHNIVSEIESKDAARIHAYLHRKEGDLWNADYWYTRSGEKRRDMNLEEEWKFLVNKFLLMH